MYCIIVQHVSFVYQYSSYICFVINSLCFTFGFQGVFHINPLLKLFMYCHVNELFLQPYTIIYTSIRYCLLYMYTQWVSYEPTYLQITQCLIRLDWQVAMDCIQHNYLYTRSEKVSSLKHNCHYSYLFILYSFGEKSF